VISEKRKKREKKKISTDQLRREEKDRKERKTFLLNRRLKLDEDRSGLLKAKHRPSAKPDSGGGRPMDENPGAS
jgi:hypothetical protein